ncbi:MULTISPECIES: membrane protein insertase YidC [Corynebacterium]|uniref:Membrane protein insertase YidC n=1 Tax=Corynebacterium aurimucosum TaxID=169292 RepID=A0A558GKK1_9CORY|nr:MULTISPECIES: membrane protein insertase YidC [unclassified Corynebacterium]TVU57385.1 membrane protein insertase YidC [Corynebacterium aurimucosum]MDK6813416.1 membrane protein insertase YidC [Corynebacterium sp. UMB6689]OFL24178.1 preprotein translocase [Corynebacterium sp. HMSC062A03]OFQ33873.1 preprotein translocase [Corynebacterium sp. HMSC072D12]OFT67823.1 preprotein translocase [Corynebacterium sp. HMSC05D03]
MISIFMYPVSGIMKLWHLLFASFLDGSMAWILTIVFLVLTVRGIIAPLNWLSVKQGRIGALMRPEMTELNERLKQADSVDDAVTILTKQRDLKERFQHNPMVGCFPVFLIFPAFIGLYQVVLRVSGSANEPVGMLTLDDVSSFRASTVFGVPLTDFAREHHDLILPMLVAALAFTSLNTLITLYRGYLTTLFDQKIPRRLLWFMALTVFLIPWMLWAVAWNGPIPVTIIFYWGCSYLFTLLQTLAYEFILHKRYPLPEAVHEQRRESIRRWRAKEKKKEKKAAKQRLKDNPAYKEELAAARKRHSAIVAEARKILKSNNRPEAPTEAE